MGLREALFAVLKTAVSFLLLLLASLARLLALRVVAVLQVIEVGVGLLGEGVRHFEGALGGERLLLGGGLLDLLDLLPGVALLAVEHLAFEFMLFLAS